MYLGSVKLGSLTKECLHGQRARIVSPLYYYLPLCVLNANLHHGVLNCLSCELSAEVKLLLA